MITLKAVLVGSSCVGALAIGGVTYATVAHPNPDLRSDAAKQVPAAKPAPAAPAPARPECVPQVPDAGNAVPEAGNKVRDAAPNAGNVHDAVPQHAQKARDAVEQQAGNAQGASVPQLRTLPNGLPNTQASTLPKTEPKAPGVPAPGVPGTDCLPDKLPKNVKPAVPAKPEVPQLPVPKKLSCDAVKPAVPVGSPLERSVILSRGLGDATKRVDVVSYKAHKFCHVTQYWTAAAGQWLKVERLQVPQRLELQQAREALKLPLGGTPTTVGDVQGWQSPLGGAVLWHGADGFAVYVSGSPAYATQVQDVAAKLQQAAAQAQ